MDKPTAKFGGVEWLGGPPAPAERATAGVVMAFVVEDGRVLPNTLAVLHARGPLAYARNVCVAMTAMKLRVIAGQPLQSAVVMPLSNASDRGHAEVVAAGTRIQATLKEMSVAERRDWLLQWGCARFR